MKSFIFVWSVHKPSLWFCTYESTLNKRSSMHVNACTSKHTQMHRWCAVGRREQCLLSGDLRQIPLPYSPAKCRIWLQPPCLWNSHPCSRQCLDFNTSVGASMWYKSSSSAAALPPLFPHCWALQVHFHVSCCRAWNAGFAFIPIHVLPQNQPKKRYSS